MRPLIAALAVSLLAFPAAAQAPAAAPAPAVITPTPKAAPVTPPKTAEQRFDTANSTRDGKLTLAQAKAGKFGAVVKNFDAIDKGHKGYVTKDDLKAYRLANKGKNHGL